MENETLSNELDLLTKKLKKVKIDADQLKNRNETLHQEISRLQTVSLSDKTETI